MFHPAKFTLLPEIFAYSAARTHQHCTQSHLELLRLSVQRLFCSLLINLQLPVLT